MCHANVKKCRDCRQRDDQVIKELNRRIRTESTAKIAKKAGLVRLHSCLANIADYLDAPPPCLCRKYVSIEKARELIRIGQAVDFESRQACFHERAIVEASKHKNPPLSTIGSKIAIERVVVNSEGNQFDKAEITRLKQTVAEDQAWRKIERDSKIDIEHDIAVEEQNKLIIFVDEGEFEEMKARSWGRPDLFVLKDERTSLGRDVGSSRGDSSIDVDESDAEQPTETEESGDPSEDANQIELDEEVEETEIEAESEEMVETA
jgi:hypothetical protein